MSSFNDISSALYQFKEAGLNVSIMSSDQSQDSICFMIDSPRSLSSLEQCFQKAGIQVNRFKDYEDFVLRGSVKDSSESIKLIKKAYRTFQNG